VKVKSSVKTSVKSWQHPVDFCDVKALLAAFKKLPVFRTTPVSLRSVKLDLGRGKSAGCSGRAFSRQRRLRFVVGFYANGADVAEVLLHELVHLALPSGTAHGERFRLVLARAAREAWGVVLDPNPEPESALWGSRGIAAYVLDRQIQAALLPLLASGAVTLPFFPPGKPRHEKLASIVEKRAEHAAKMLARAERRLKLARTIAGKWKKKVSYYERAERIAAKPGTRGGDS
jgi:hypothetical protein